MRFLKNVENRKLGGTILKKLHVLLMASLFAILLVACGQEKAANKEDGSTGGKLTAEDILMKSTEEMADVKSYAMNIDANIDMNIDGEQMSMPMQMEGRYTVDPFMGHTTTTTALEGEEFAVDSYFDGEAVYMDLGGMWAKMTFDTEELPEDIKAQLQGYDPSQEIEELKAVSDYIDLKEQEGHYIITIDSSNDTVKKFILEKMNSLNGDMMMTHDSEQALEAMNIQSLSYKVMVDKNTFLVSQLEMSMSLTINDGEMPVDMKMDMTTKYNQYNEIESIVVPQEAIEQAIEMDGSAM
jgi:hypothetical protein